MDDDQDSQTPPEAPSVEGEQASGGDSAKPPPGDAENQSPAPRADPKAIQQERIPNLLPVLPIRDSVVFPGTIMPLNVGREK